MKYICLVYFEPSIWDHISESEMHTLTDESQAYDKHLMNTGHYIHAEALQSVNTATTIRVRDGRTSVTDGPFSETKEVLGGFILVEAKDLDAAMQIAAKIPLARYGSIEIRPILEFT